LLLLGTVAIEPNRWGTVDPARRATIDVADWLDDIAGIGFEGVELWDGHANDAVAAHRLPVPIFNSYASLDDRGAEARDAAARWAERLGAHAIKFNVGSDPTAASQYAERVADWSSRVADDVVLLCECHAGTIAEDPSVAAHVLDASGRPDRVGAIVHTHEDDDSLRHRFDSYGDRIRHVHVNLLDHGRMPRLRDVQDRLAHSLDLLAALGFHGTWTLEFVHGLLTEADRPAALLEQAADDFAVLRALLDR
jgi:sugar phosphate isomerase/epimerase